MSGMSERINQRLVELDRYGEAGIFTHSTTAPERVILTTPILSSVVDGEALLTRLRPVEYGWDNLWRACSEWMLEHTAEQRTQWVKGLQVGDEVLVVWGKKGEPFKESNVEWHRVEDRHADGTLRVGYLPIGSNGHYLNATIRDARLVPARGEPRDRARHRFLSAEVRRDGYGARWGQVPLELLEQLAKALEVGVR